MEKIYSMRISIITINFNHKEGLKRTIESVVSQSIHDFEWIIIDGGSTDGSKALLEQYDNYITFWVSERDYGIYNAMNKGIRKSSGDYLLFLNSGDYLYNCQTIEKVLLTNCKSDLIIGKLAKEINNKMIIEPGYENSQLTAADIFLKPVPHQATFINRKLFEKFGFYDESFKIVSDWKFFLYTIVFGNVSVELLNIPISVFECNGISETNARINIIERDKVLKELFPKSVLNDYNYALSLKEISKYKVIYKLYSCLYRLAMFCNKSRHYLEQI